MERIETANTIGNELKRTLQVLTLVAITTATQLAAQDGGRLPTVPNSLSLDDAISIAARWSPAHRQVANDRGPAAWGVRNAYASFLPSMSVNGGVGYTGSGSQRFLSSEFTTPPTIGSSYGINLNWSFDISTIVQPGLQRAQLHATEASILSSEIGLASNIAQQYLTVLQAQDEVELALAQLQRNDEALRLAEARRDVGQGTLLDVRQAQVLKGQSEVRVLQEQQDVRVEKLRLFELMGVPGGANLEAVALTEEFPVAELDWTVDELLQMAHSDNPDLNSLRSQEASAGWGVTASKVNWYPRVSASIGWAGFTQAFTRQSDVDAQIANDQASVFASLESCNLQNSLIGLANQSGGSFPLQNCSAIDTSPTALASRADAIRVNNNRYPFDFTNQPFSARIGISIPIFSNFNRPLQVSRAHMQLEDAREAVRARELRVETEVNQSYYAMTTNFQTIAIQERNRVAAAEALRLASERYRLGSGDYIQLQDAQVAAQQAEFDYIQALYAFHRSIATLETSVGRRLR